MKIIAHVFGLILLSFFAALFVTYASSKDDMQADFRAWLGFSFVLSLLTVGSYLVFFV